MGTHETVFYSCAMCQRTFSTFQLLGKHLQVDHSAPHASPCTICNNLLIGHQHAINVQAKLINVTCHKFSISKSILESLNLPIQAENCLFVTSVVKHFQDHITLKVHDRIHTGGQPYRCGQCDRTFLDTCDHTVKKSHMKLHIDKKKIHLQTV